MQTLGDFIKVKHGYAFKGDYFSTENNGIVLVTPGNFSIGGGFKEDKCKFFTADYPEDYVLHPNDLIVTMTDLSKSMDTLGYSALVPQNNNVYLHNQRIGLVQILDNKKLDKHYLYWFMRSYKYQRTIANTSSGTTVHHTSPDKICAVEIDLPSILVQKKVASILDDIERKINVNSEINNNLEQQARAIFKKMFLDANTTTQATIADISLNVTDGVHNTVQDDPNGECLLLSCKNIKGGYLTKGSNERTISKATFDKLRKRTNLSKGDVLVSSVGTIGEIMLLNESPHNYEFQRSVAMIKPNLQYVSSYYLYEALLAQKSELVNAAHGAVQQCLFIGDIANFLIGVPKKDDLEKFDHLVSPMFDSITSNQKESLKLCLLRDALHPRLMSGELDVSNINL